MPFLITKSDKNNEEEQEQQSSQLNKLHTLHDIDRFIYDADSIETFRMNEAIQDHPLFHRPTNIRSKLAYADILKVCKPTTKYLLPGQISIFGYSEPKYKEELEYYDKTPMTIFLGIFRTKNGDIRELGLNIHYYPPRIRMRILNTTYEIFKHHFQKYFNDAPGKPATFINYNAIKHIMKHNVKIGFGIKEYIPVLRGNTYVLPTRLLPTAFFTEGHFSRATLAQIQKFWRQF